VAQVQGIGLMLEAMSNELIPYHLGVFFIPLFIALYLIMGGMKGAAWVNTIQGLFFSFMVILLFFVVMSQQGGFVPTMDAVYAKHPELFELGQKGGKVWGLPMIFGFAAAMSLGCVCFPQPYMHAYSSRTAKGLKAMFLSFGGICIIIITMPILVGIAGTILVPGLSGVEADKVYGLIASEVLSEPLAALVVAGGFTAAMSTVNGMVFGNAMNIANDLYKLARPNMLPQEQIAVARICVLAILIISVIIAWDPTTPVAELSVVAFGMVAVTLFPLLGAYFWKRATAFGAISATVIGAGLNVYFVLKGGSSMILMPQPVFFNLNGFLFAFILTGIVFFTGCLITKPGRTEKDSLSLFFHPSLSK
jgi:SSS family solute:Na+ symporter